MHVWWMVSLLPKIFQFGSILDDVWAIEEDDGEELGLDMNGWLEWLSYGLRMA